MNAALIPSPLSEQQARVLRRLALDLVGDPGLADEAVQHARIQASHGAPPAMAARKRWLARVTGRQAIRLARDHARQQRLQIEGGRARPQGARSTAEVVAQRELAARLEAVVGNLQQPYRETICLRYFEGLAPRTIAQRMSVPVATVRTRLQRGLQQIRGELDRGQPRDREAWRATMLGYVPVRKGLGFALALGCAVVALPLLYWSMSKRADFEGPVVVSQASELGASAIDSAMGERHGATSGFPTSVDAIEVRSTAAHSGAPASPRPDESGVLIQGKVLDEYGRKVVGAQILCGTSRFDAKAVNVRSDGNGAFRFRDRSRSSSFYVVAMAKGYYATEGCVLHLPPPPPTQPYAPTHEPPPVTLGVQLRLFRGGMRVHGRVTRFDGAAARGARVRLRSLNHSSAPTTAILHAIVDREGHYDFPGVPHGQCELDVRMRSSRGDGDDYASRVIHGDVGDMLRVDLRGAPTCNVDLRVEEEDGRPVRSVRVTPSLGPMRWQDLETDRFGELSLEALPAGVPCQLELITEDGRGQVQSIEGLPPGDHKRTIRLVANRGRTLRCTLRWAKQSDDDGSVSATVIDVSDNASWTSESMRVLADDEDGSFVFYDAPKRARIAVYDRDEDFPVHLSEAFDTTSGTVVVTVPPMKLCRVQGFVTLPDGIDPTAVHVHLQVATGEHNRSAALLDDGEFEFVGIPAGRYRIVARSEVWLEADLGEVEVHDKQVNTGRLIVPIPEALEFSLSSSLRDEASKGRNRLVNRHGHAVAQWDKWVPKSLRIAPGSYTLELSGRTAASFTTMARAR